MEKIGFTHNFFTKNRIDFINNFFTKNRIDFINNFFTKNRRGQFYLLAAIIIIAVMIGFAVVSNYSKKSLEFELYDMGEELGIESSAVLDFGTMTGEDKIKIIDDSGNEILGENIMNHFTTLYDEYAGEDREIYYIFGNADGEVIAYSYDEVIGGTIDIIISEQSSGLNVLRRTRDELGEIESIYGKIKVKIKYFDYEFDLKEGENFYFVISQEISGNEIIVTG